MSIENIIFEDTDTKKDKAIKTLLLNAGNNEQRELIKPLNYIIMEFFINFLAVCFFALLFLFCAKNNEKQPNKLNYYIGIASVLSIIVLTANFVLTIIEQLC